MRGARLDVARRIAEKTFIKQKGFSPQIRRWKECQIRWTEDDIQRILGIYRKTKVVCSCYMCRNRRQRCHMTLQEVRHHLDADAQYDEIGWVHRKIRWERWAQW